MCKNTRQFIHYRARNSYECYITDCFWGRVCGLVSIQLDIFPDLLTSAGVFKKRGEKGLFGTNYGSKQACDYTESS